MMRGIEFPSVRSAGKKDAKGGAGQMAPGISMGGAESAEGYHQRLMLAENEIALGSRMSN